MHSGQSFHQWVPRTLSQPGAKKWDLAWNSVCPSAFIFGMSNSTFMYWLDKLREWLGWSSPVLLWKTEPDITSLNLQFCRMNHTELCNLHFAWCLWLLFQEAASLISQAKGRLSYYLLPVVSGTVYILMRWPIYDWLKSGNSPKNSYSLGSCLYFFCPNKSGIPLKGASSSPQCPKVNVWL